MSENGNGRANTLVGLGSAIVQGLSPPFLVMALLNIVLVYLVLSNIEAQGEQRLQILTKVIDHCLVKDIR